MKCFVLTFLAILALAIWGAIAAGLMGGPIVYEVVWVGIGVALDVALVSWLMRE